MRDSDIERTTEDQSGQLSRRTMLKRAGAAGVATAWTVPVVQTLGMSGAAAAPGSPPPPAGTATVAGTVVNAVTGAAIAGAVVRVVGTSLTATTDSLGAYTITNVPSGSQTLEAAASGFVTGSQAVAVPTSGAVTVNFALSPLGDAVRAVLTWGPVPTDLDLHASGPDGAGGRFHAAYYDRTPTNFVTLDRDDVTSYGPETITITVRPGPGGTYVAGNYQVWVHNYSTTPEFDASGARVTLTGTTGQLADYRASDVTSGSPSLDIWRVVSFDLDAAGNVSGLTPLQTFQSGTASSTFP